MSDTKFTPGPWKVTDYRDIMDENGETFVGVSFRQSPAERRANAHLIAAAPELYTALVWAMGKITPPNSVCTDEAHERFNFAMSAIAKAEGDPA